MPRLFVNIDHVATLRNQRGTIYPDPLTAASICEQNGATGITVHLREDRRHIKDRDVELLREKILTNLNLEMAATEEMIIIATKIKPDMVCVVPEKRTELTTEGGLDVKGNFKNIAYTVEKLRTANISVSLFIEPDFSVIDKAKETKCDAVEIHTGAYANAKTKEQMEFEQERINKSIVYATGLGLKCNLGHGLDYHNIRPFIKNEKISEFNIGHSIISRAVLTGLAEATRTMLDIIKGNL